MMLAMDGPNALLILWITFTAVALLGLIAVLVWAVRSRQFADQDLARYLPLKSGIPGESPATDVNKKEDTAHAHNDVLQNQWLILALLGGLALVVTTVLWYLAFWRDRADTAGEKAVPWLLILIYAATVIFAIGYLLLCVKEPPNW